MLKNTIKLLKDVLFPRRCFCGKPDFLICPKCLDGIQRNKKDLCPLCRRLSANGKTCSNCRSKSRLTGVMIFGDHKGILKDAIWQLKYESIIDFAKPLSKLLSEKYGDFIKEKRFIITSVPISKRRYLWRGYNQAAEIAKSLARELGLEYVDFLNKAEASPQVGLSKKERIANLRGKIDVKTDLLVPKKVLIVDDVYTTGSTLEESAHILRDAGAKEVWGIVLSRD